MANDLTGNPLVVDTAAVLTTSPVRVVAVIVKPGGTGRVFELKDNTGRIVLSLKSHGTTAEEQIAVEMGDTRFMGLNATTVTSGLVGYIYTNAVS